MNSSGTKEDVRYFGERQLTYTRYYCEENVYMLCKTISDCNPEILDKCTVIFISNPSKAIPVWGQKSRSDGYPVVWDYHVILCINNEPHSLNIYDFDSVLPFPCPANEYIFGSFHPELVLQERYKRFFRLIPAQKYLEHFASDRSHMLENGEYSSPPPEYAAIRTKEDIMNLPRYIDMMNETQSEIYGHVVSEEAFFQLAGHVDQPAEIPTAI